MFRSNKANRKREMGRHMVETNRLKEKGLDSGALREDKGDVLLIDDGWHRICAPLKKEKKMHALIFWNKGNSKDEASWDNQVSNYCHCLPKS